MHQDFEARKQELEKRKLDVLGEQFILDSQLETLKKQAQKLQAQKKEHDTTVGKQLFELEKKVKDTGKIKFNFESELRNLTAQNQQEAN